MKTPILLSIVTGLAAFTAIAQENDTQGAGNQNNQNDERKGPPPSRLVLVLDADHDRVISAEEIAASSDALETLDKNADGELTRDEFARPRPRKGGDAKEREEGDKPSSQRQPPPDRVAGALDSDHDGVITQEEIAAAPEALATLDKNEDGQLTRDEFAPKPRRKPHGSDDSAQSGGASGDDKGSSSRDNGRRQPPQEPEGDGGQQQGGR